MNASRARPHATAARLRLAAATSNPVARVLGFSVLLAAASLALYGRVARGLGPAGLPRDGVEMLFVTAGYALAEAAVLHIEFRRNAHSLSLNEIPLVIGLVFLSPTELLAAHLVAGLLVLGAYKRQPVLKLGFNLAHFAFEDCLALVTFYAVLPGAVRLGPGLWLAATVAALVASAVGMVSVSAVIWLHQSRVDLEQLHEVVAVSAAGTLLNACVGLVAVTVLWGSARGWLLLLPLASMLGVAYAAYASLRQRHSRLESLYRFTQVLNSAGDANAIAADVLTQAREMLNAEIAELALLTGGTDSSVQWLTLENDTTAPSRVVEPSLHPSVAQLLALGCPVTVCAEGSREPAIRAHLAQRGQRDGIVAALAADDQVLGLLSVANRLGDVATFDEDDGRLFATIAAQTSTALQNARLLDRLRHEALHDSLTGLANRALLKQRLGESIARRRPTDPEIAVVLIDLDRFKEINDTLGHETGDLVLQEVATRLGGISRPVTVARLGGDEFALLDVSSRGPEDALALAAMVRERIDRPFAHRDLQLRVSATVGVALSPLHGEDVSTLLRRADGAMYTAKNTAHGVVLYAEDLDENTPRRLALVNELRTAIEHGGLELHYQPQMHIETRAVTGVEALLRWTHPTEGFVPPDEFIPIAERTGLIGPLTDFVLDTALEQCRVWQRRGWELSVAVNVSARNLLDSDLVRKISDALERNGVDPSRLVLEITETSVMAEPEDALRVLDRLAALGVTLAVDDFGTGYSSLAYLKRLPVREVKIDKSFVLNMHDDENDAVIVRSTVDLARNLGLRVTAEGVETAAALHALTAMGCDTAQGYLISPPLPADRLRAWLDAQLPLANRVPA